MSDRLHDAVILWNNKKAKAMSSDVVANSTPGRILPMSGGTGHPPERERGSVIVSSVSELSEKEIGTIIDKRNPVEVQFTPSNAGGTYIVAGTMERTSGKGIYKVTGEVRLF